MLKLFHATAVRVPAYKNFLKKHKVSANTIQSVKDFINVPVMTKDNYLRRYSMQDLCWDGTLEKPLTFAATSGSTGKPFYFPREHDLSWEYSLLIDLFLENGGRKGPTLVIICLGMGVWVGGLITFQAFEKASERGANLSILTPGLNKDEIFHALRDLAPNYSTTILVGYPPFIKDVLDEASLAGIRLGKLNLRLLFAAESFSEKFRDRVGKLAGVNNVLKDTLNIYGTADIGAMAYETPTAILARRLASKKQKFFQSLFGPLPKTPTLAQYNPLFTSFEAVDGQILLTGNNAIPLVRYAVGDNGGVHTFDGLEEAAVMNGTSILDAAKREDAPVFQLPFVYVYERLDFSVKLSGAIIYPEPIREALLDPALIEQVTGRFALQVLRDEHQDPYLEVNVEMRHDVKASPHVSETVQKKVVELLLKNNSEYKAIYESMKSRATPHIALWPQGHALYFTPTIKQKWVIKSKPS